MLQIALKIMLLVARERFELSSAGPEPAMLDRYTTGLQLEILGFFVISLTLKFQKRKNRHYLFSSFSVASSMQ